MSAKIAVISDIHLSDLPGTAQEAALRYALSRLQEEKPAVVLVLGDVTAAGTLEAADRVRTVLDESGLCFRMVPGNSDERTPALYTAVAERLTVNTPFYSDRYAVGLLDIHEGRLTPQGRDALTDMIEGAGGREVILGSHYPLEVCLEDPVVRKVIESEKISLFVGAHFHYDQEHRGGEMAMHIVRGLDPDKAIGAPPAVSLFELKDREWKLSYIPFDDGTVTGWSSSMRQEFIGLLGFSCMSKSLEGLHEASLHDVRCVELRSHDAILAPKEELLTTVTEWRDSGGRILSMHMPDLSYENERSEITGIDTFRDAVSLALELGVERMTLHVPRAPVSLLRPDSEAWNNLTSTFLELLKEPIAKDVTIGVENMHMNPGEAADDSRRFGYLPDECCRWVEGLRKKSGYNSIGVHLDIGHARNNHPFSKKVSVGQWYVLIGKEVVGYHLHQVSRMMENHNPITDVYGPMISLSSFFWGWKTGGLCHAPMFLEIRSDNFQDTVDSLQCIRQYVREG